MATSLKARPAELTDVGDIAEIYNQGIEDRTAGGRRGRLAHRLLVDKKIYDRQLS